MQDIDYDARPLAWQLTFSADIRYIYSPTQARRCTSSICVVVATLCFNHLFDATNAVSVKPLTKRDHGHVQ